MAYRYLKDLGRNGDTDIVHVNEREKAMLRAAGGSGTINPHTGLREYYIGMGEDTAADIAAAFSDPSVDEGGFGGPTGSSPADVAEFGMPVGISDSPSVDAGGFGDFMGPAPEDAVTFDAPVAEAGIQSFPSFGQTAMDIAKGKSVDPATAGIYGATNLALGGIPSAMHGALSAAFGPPTGMADMDPSSSEGTVGGPEGDYLGRGRASSSGYGSYMQRPFERESRAQTSLGQPQAYRTWVEWGATRGRG